MDWTPVRELQVQPDKIPVGGGVTLDGITPYYRRRSSIPGHINAAGPGLTKKGGAFPVPSASSTFISLNHVNL